MEFLDAQGNILLGNHGPVVFFMARALTHTTHINTAAGQVHPFKEAAFSDSSGFFFSQTDFACLICKNRLQMFFEDEFKVFRFSRFQIKRCTFQNLD